MNARTCMVLAVVCLQYVHLATGTEQWTYSFKANSSIDSYVADDSILSEWRLSGNLVIQNFGARKTMKLADMKSIGYHGPNSETLALHEVTVPDASDILALPFVAHYNVDVLDSVSFMPEDPVWSRNMKSAIASLFQVDLDAGGGDSYKKVEKNIFGECDIKYRFMEDKPDVFKFTKSIRTVNCKTPSKTNPIWPDVRYGKFEGAIEREYTYVKNGPAYPGVHFDDIESEAYFRSTVHLYQCMIRQNQILKLIDSSPVEDTIDVSEVTSRQSPTYQFVAHDGSQGEYGERDPALIAKWNSVYAEFTKWLAHNKSEVMNEENFGRLEQMQKIMSTMNANTFGLFQDDAIGNKKLLNMFTALLPTLGTANAVQFMRLVLLDRTIDGIAGLRAVSEMPFNLQSPNVAFITLLNELGPGQIKNKFINYAHALILSNFVGVLNKYVDADKPNLILNRIIEKYVNQFYKLYLETNAHDFDTRMKCILGLSNMGPLATRHLLSIVQNTTESVYVRTLATNAIRMNNYLDRYEPFQRFWPIVRDRTETLEMRVAALGVLLESRHLEDSEMDAILQYMNQLSEEPVDQHLFNYFYTTMTSGKPNWEGVTALSPDSLYYTTPELRKPVSTKGLMTGNFFAGYKNHFGTSYEAVVVAKPDTNFYHSLYLSMKNYLGDERLSSYTVYLKMEGIDRNAFREWSVTEHPVKDLLKILQMAHVALVKPTRDTRVEFAIFKDNRALFSLFVDSSNWQKEIADVFSTEVWKYFKSDVVALNEVAHTEYISDLGTPISIALRHKQVLSFSEDVADRTSLYNTRAKYAQAYTVDYKTVNPLTNINHGLLDIDSKQTVLKLAVSAIDCGALQWKDDDVYFDALLERRPAMYIEAGENMAEHCPQCKALYFLKANDSTAKSDTYETDVKRLFALQSNYTSLLMPPDGREVKNYTNVLMPTKNVPLYLPLLSLQYTADYLFYQPRAGIWSTFIRWAPKTSEPSEFTLKFSYDKKIDESKRRESRYNLTVDLEQTRVSDHKVLYYNKFNITTHPTDKGQYVKFHHDNNGIYELDLHSKIDYTSVEKSRDRFSLTAAAPMNTKTSVHYKDASVSTTVDITTSFYITDALKLLIKKDKMYEECEAESASLRHAAPTKSCYISSLGLAVYDGYAIDVEVKNASEQLFTSVRDVLQPVLISKDEAVMKDFNMSLHITVMEKVFTVAMTKSFRQEYDQDVSEFTFLIAKDKMYDYLMHDKYGGLSYCIITPKHVKTFTEQTIRNDKVTTMIPLIECNSDSRVGLLTRRTKDKLDFKLWIDDTIFLVEHDGDKSYTVKMNDTAIDKDHFIRDLSIEFLAKNTLYIKTNRFNVFYNQDYVSVELRGGLVNRLCGICSTGVLTAPDMITFDTTF